MTAAGKVVLGAMFFIALAIVYIVVGFAATNPGSDASYAFILSGFSIIGMSVAAVIAAIAFNRK